MAIRSGSCVLETPLEICTTVTEFFPEARGQTEVANGLLHVTITFSATQPRLVIQNAVDKASFVQVLTKISNKIFFDRQINDERPYPIDVRKFSMVKELHDWPTFRQVMYEREGRSCVQAIISYIQNQTREQLALLESLGLAPEQVRGQPVRERELDYFVAVLAAIQQLGKAEKESMMRSIRGLFPIMLDQALRKRIERRIEGERQGKIDPYQELLPILRSRVHGQDLATHELAATLASQSSQGRNQVFLFIGPTGVGKTELAKAAATRKKGLVTFLMHDYTASADNWKLFGSASGHVGSTDRPNFVKEVDPYATIVAEGREVKDAVILFDEFEKAHNTVKQSLLTLFSDWHIRTHYTSGDTNCSVTYKFSGCVFICTSNLFQGELVQFMRRNTPIEEIRRCFGDLNKHADMPNTCSPELLGRVTIIPFGPIPRGECYQNLLRSKLRVFLTECQKEFLCRECIVENEQAVLHNLENKLYGDGTDIRRVARWLEEAKRLVYSKKGAYGNMQLNKMTLFVNAEQKSCFRISAFDTDLECYCEGIDTIVLP